MYPSSSQYKSWTSRSSTHSAPSYPTASPGPMPGAPQLRTVSLPHPNSTPYPASSSSSHHPSSFESPSCVISVNPLLSWTGVPQLYYNVTRDVQCIQFKQGCTPNLLQQPAVHPARTFLVLSIPSLPPWSTFEVRNERGVSAYDVLVRIRDVLNRSVSPAEMGAMGMKRIDFLGPNVFFAGLSMSRDGQDRWEVHFVPRA
ncbi:hypothetical protein EV363DRAFT_703992 [Boletus edulis]|nr:hypothetical protein EV363DRAFT_703992 [Boletus edulis]